MPSTGKPTPLQLADLLENTDKWDEVFRRYQQATWHPDSVTEDESVQADLEIVYVLRTILRFYTDSAQALERWELPGYLMDPFGFTLVAKAEKQNHEYEFGIEANVFFLQTLLHAPWTIKYAGMDFWRDLTEIDALGTLTFEENSVPTGPPENKAHNHLLKVGKSAIYRLIRNLVLFEAEGPEPEDSKLSSDFGWLKVAWRVNEITWEDLLQKGALVFRHLYQMNYTLWRHQYQYEHALLARLKKRQRPTPTAE